MIQTGGTRTIETSDENREIIVDSENNPITEKVIMPKIEGANIIQAVSAVTGLATHKIQVFKMSN